MAGSQSSRKAPGWPRASRYSEERWIARGLLAVVIGLNLGLVYINVLLNQWNNAFYNTLQNMDKDEFFVQLGRFAMIAAAYIVVAVYQLYLNQMLQIRWRRWLTGRYLQEWIGARTYYRLQLTDRGTDNPDQRIADDLKHFFRRKVLEPRPAQVVEGARDSDQQIGRAHV